MTEMKRFLDQLSLDGPLEPFLVFADYLQDRGDPWGELIAMQCQTTDDLEKKKAFGLASLRLLDQLADTLCPRPAHVGIAWKRGFVQFIGFSDSEHAHWFDEQLAQLFARPACALCNELLLAGAHLDDAHAVVLLRHKARLQALPRLDLRSNWFSPSVMKNLARVFPKAMMGGERGEYVPGQHRTLVKSWGGRRSPDEDR
jgi:hypothetical protein